MAAKRLTADDIATVMTSMEGLVTTVPEQLIQYYLKRSGLDCKDESVVKLMSLAAQRFVESLIRDAAQIHKRHSGQPQQKGKDAGRATPALTSEDLAAALEEYGIKLGHQSYFADQLPAQGPTGR